MTRLFRSFLFLICSGGVGGGCSTSNLRDGDAGHVLADAGRDAGRGTGAPEAGRLDAGQDASGGGGSDAGPTRSHGLEKRVENTTCFLNGSPPLEVVPVGHAAAFV